MDGKNWQCPSCGIHATLSKADFSDSTYSIATGTSLAVQQGIALQTVLVRCPNQQCQKLEFVVHARYGLAMQHGAYTHVSAGVEPVGVGSFQFLPTTSQPLSSFVPASIQEDYTEAYLIRSLSPKAAATLARRALQGMIRDFWGVAKGTLAEELRRIQDQCDPALYEAMLALKAIGNIGAHPERDISLVVEIEPGETEQLLDLIHLLDAEWYVARANRRRRLEMVKSLGAEKRPPKPTEAG